MSIPDHFRANFETMLSAARAENLCLVECKDALSGEPRYVICAVSVLEGEFTFVPFGHLAQGNPFEAYIPPGP